MRDLISRQAAIELIERIKPYHQDADDIAEMIANMPSAQPERLTGRWIFNRYYTWECSECGESPTKGTGYTQSSDELYAFCPHCGSYNGGEQDG